MNECGACGERFGSVAAFDRHRVGRHAYTYSEGVHMEPMREDGRRCLSASELDEVFVRNSRGTWSLPKSLAHARSLR